MLDLIADAVWLLYDLIHCRALDIEYYGFGGAAWLS